MVNIYITAGAIKYVGGTLYEVNGKDISGDTYQLGLSTSSNVAPTLWSTPDVSTAGTAPLVVNINGASVTIPTTAQRILKLLVSSSLPANNIPSTGQTSGYWVWVKVSDSPEIEPVSLQGPLIFL